MDTEPRDSVGEHALRLGIRLDYEHKPCRDCGRLHLGHCKTAPGPTRDRVRDAADRLASDAWERREIEGELERVREMRQLTRDQLDEDVWSTATRGREYFGAKSHRTHSVEAEPRGDGRLKEDWLWKPRSETQHAIIAAMEPLIGEGSAILTAEERVKVWLYYNREETLEVLAERYGFLDKKGQPDRKAMLRDIRKIGKKVRATVMLLYGPQEESDEQL